MFGHGRSFPGGVYGGGFPGRDGPVGTFKAQYRCYSVSIFTERREVEEGGKVIMPPSALDALTQLNTQYPMLFKMTNSAAQTTSYCGVLEFIADEGKIYIPYWMMRNLCLQEGGLLEIESATLQLGTYVLLEPQSRGILDLYNPKAVLEASLRKLSCLSLGDMLDISYNKKSYQFRVKELRPAKAVSIIECDLSVDFAPYVGFEEDEKKRKAKEADPMAVVHEKLKADERKRIGKVLQEAAESGSFQAFGGKGNILEDKTAGNAADGDRAGKKTRRKAKLAAAAAESQSAAGDVANQLLGRERGIPNFNHQRGTLHFTRLFPDKEDDMEADSSFSAFDGDGHCLRPKKR